MAKGGLGECFAACVQRGGSEFRRQVCVCVAEQWTSRDRAQLGRVGCVCVGGDCVPQLEYKVGLSELKV